MTFGFMILYNKFTGYCSFVMADDVLYEGVKRDFMKAFGSLSFVYGRKELDEKKMDIVCNRVNGLIKRLNNDEFINIEKELSSLL